MNRVSIALLIMPLIVPPSFAQNSSSTTQQTPAAVAHGAFPVKTVKALDSSKLKTGDAVEVETIGSFKLADGTVVPKGSRLTGHVSDAKARSRGDAQSDLTVDFEKLNIVKGKQLPLKGKIQALFPPADEVDPGVPGAATAHGAGGSPVQSAAPPPPDYRPMGDVTQGSNTSGNGKIDPAVDPRSTGVHGLHDLSLDDGTISSQGKQVKVGSGVRMIVKADIFP